MPELDGADLYHRAAAGWSAGAELVYQPLAHALVAVSPMPLADRCILDLGAGTGAGSRALQAVGAIPIAVDLALAMLRHDRALRPPAVVADVRRLPFAAGAADGALAPFVLNHVDQPVLVLGEVARGVRPGGVVLASTFSDADRPPVKELVDAVAIQHGWTPPPSYVWLKDHALDLLGSAGRMADAATAAGLVDVTVTEGPVEVGVSSVRDLVAFRLGMAHLSDFLASRSEDDRAALVAEAEAAVAQRHDGSDLAPSVVFLAARVAG